MKKEFLTLFWRMLTSFYEPLGSGRSDFAAFATLYYPKFWPLWGTAAVRAAGRLFTLTGEFNMCRRQYWKTRRNLLWGESCHRRANLPCRKPDFSWTDCFSPGSTSETQLWRWMNLCRTNLWSFLSKNALIGHRIILGGQWFRLATRIFFRLQLERKNVNWIFLPCMTSNYTKPFAQKNQRTMEWKFEGWSRNYFFNWRKRKNAKIVMKRWNLK